MRPTGARSRLTKVSGPDKQRSLASRDILVVRVSQYLILTRGMHMWSTGTLSPTGTPHSAEDLARPRPRLPLPAERRKRCPQAHMTHTTATRHRTSSGARATDRRSHSTPTVSRGYASTVATRGKACMPACCAHRRAPRTGRVRRVGGPQSERVNSKHSDVLRKSRRRGRCSQDRRSRGRGQRAIMSSSWHERRPSRGA